ncbi:MAG: hypothetical protein FJW40_26075 [Acidobacteria bacterium]|nr:hypothetical protein [Acidobacteriota bacterium]
MPSASFSEQTSYRATGFRIGQKLGQGGAGVVFLARDLLLERDVAIKFLLPPLVSDSLAMARLRSEARACSALDHPRIARIHMMREEFGAAYIVLEYLPGGSLMDLLRQQRGALPLDLVLQAALDSGSGLAYAHRQGFQHRDVKPSNILRAADGAWKLADFGLARAAGVDQSLTDPAHLVGTASYMAPEQVLNRPADHRADIFAFGVTLYQLATGDLPFRADSTAAVLHAIAYQAHQPLRLRRPDLPAPFARLVDDMLAKDPGARPQSMDAVLAELKQLNTHLVDTITLPGGLGTPVIADAARPAAKRPISIWASLTVAALLAVCLYLAYPELLRVGTGLPAERRIAVLMFTNIGGDPANQPVCDGVAETLASRLTGLEQFHDRLWVVPTTEVRRNNVASAGDARRLLGANLALTGSIERTSKTLRLNINLVDAITLRQLRSETVDYPVSELAAMQDSVANRVTNMLALVLPFQSGAVHAAGQTGHSAAYEAFLRGQGT